jgi:hypothetical protein
MLVTRQCDTGRKTWSSSKLEALYPNAASPRMSNFEPLSTLPDWREQYSPFSLSSENGLLQPSFQPPPTPNVSETSQNQQQGVGRPQLEHRHSLGPQRQDTQTASTLERSDFTPVDYRSQINNLTRDDSLVSTESTALSLGSIGSNPLSSASSAPVQQGTLANNGEDDAQIALKEEEDDEDDENDMLDAEEGSSSIVPQTAAERRAERRKMKRFR